MTRLWDLLFTVSIVACCCCWQRVHDALVTQGALTP